MRIRDLVSLTTTANHSPRNDQYEYRVRLKEPQGQFDRNAEIGTVYSVPKGQHVRYTYDGAQGKTWAHPTGAARSLYLDVVI